MVHGYALGLGALAVAALVAAVAHQLLVDSSVFELDGDSWFPDRPAGLPFAVVQSELVVSGVAPAVGTLLAAALVVSTPFRTWAWAVVAVVAATDVASPLLHQYQVPDRAPNDVEREAIGAALDRLGGDQVAVRVVGEPDERLVSGYALGGPFADVVGVGAGAVATLEPPRLAALLAHELGHHREYHTLVRAGAGVAVLLVGTAALTAATPTLTPAAVAGLVVVVAAERLASDAAYRYTEFRADAYAAGQVGTGPVVKLLVCLDEHTEVDQSALPWYQRLFSTHPTFERRIARLRERAADGARAGGDVPAG